MFLWLPPPPSIGYSFTLRSVNSPYTSLLLNAGTFMGPCILSYESNREDPGQWVKGTECRPETQCHRVTPAPELVPEDGQGLYRVGH